MIMVNMKHIMAFSGLVVFAFIAFMALNSGVPSSAEPAGCGSGGCSGMAIGDANAREFVVVAGKYRFEPSMIAVNKGDKVKLTLKSADVAHGLAIPDYGVDIKVGAGGQQTVEFVAGTAGTFNFNCNVYCGSGHADMAGKLVVNDGAGAQVQQPSGAGSAGSLQVVAIHANPYGGYDNPTVTVKAGQPVRLDFSADPRAGCGRQIIVDNVGVNLVSRNGETVSATFTPPRPGNYAFHCSMNMFRGMMVAV